MSKYSNGQKGFDLFVSEIGHELTDYCIALFCVIYSFKEKARTLRALGEKMPVDTLEIIMKSPVCPIAGLVYEEGIDWEKRLKRELVNAAAFAEDIIKIRVLPSSEKVQRWLDGSG